MSERDELTALRRLAALEAKAAGAAKSREAPPIAGGIDPTEGQSFGENTMQGIGAGMTSVLRAVGGGKLAAMMGLPATQEEAARLDAPLDATAGGKIGRVVGTAAPAALAIPFTAATVPAALASGAITGALMTEGDAGDRAMGAALGGAGGALGQAAVPAYRAARGLVSGIVEPFTQAGSGRIAGRAIDRFATNRNALQSLSGGPTETGALPTLAEATRDPGLATLQRAISTLDPEAAAVLAARREANNAARIDSLGVLTGQPSAPVSGVGALNRIAAGQPTREAAEALRSAAARKSYGAAFEAGIDQEAADAIAPQIASLMARPSVRAGMARARNLAAEEGINIDNAGGSVQGLHYLKTALDDMAGRLRDQPTKLRLVQQTSADLASTLEEISPLYQQARREYQFNSVPVNRAAVGERLMERAQGAIRDFSGNRKLQANAFARALNDEDQLLRQSGVKGGATSLDDLLTATQSSRVRAVRNELETLANLDSAANGPGSQTAKMLASQNLLRQVAGPLGLPEGFIESVLSQTLMRPVQFGYQAAEPRIVANIGRALLDPAEAARLTQGARTYDRVAITPNQLQALVQRLLPTAGVGGAASYRPGQ